jgi:hypothetical protein
LQFGEIEKHTGANSSAIIGGCEAMVETTVTLRPRRCNASTRERKSPSPESITI